MLLKSKVPPPPPLLLSPLLFPWGNASAAKPDPITRARAYQVLQKSGMRTDGTLLLFSNITVPEPLPFSADPTLSWPSWESRTLPSDCACHLVIWSSRSMDVVLLVY